MATSNVERAREGFAAALRGDLDAIAELLAPDVRWHGGDPSAPGACTNRDQALEFMRRSDALGTGRLELVDVVGSGDRVAVIMRPPGGGTVANVTTFRDGKVIEMVHYPNPDDALAAVASSPG